MRVALVEDDPILRKSLGLILAGEPRIEQVEEFARAEDALRALDEGLVPDVAIVDIELPGMDGVHLTRELKSRQPDLEVMVLTISTDREIVLAALKAGASGYVLKGSTPREVVEAIHSVHEGGAPMTPRIARRLLLELREREEPSPLTPREVEILQRIEQGLSPREIAEAFVLSLHTVQTHLKRVYEKLQASSRDEALRKARRKGLL